MPAHFFSISKIMKNINFDNIDNFFKKGQSVEKIAEINGVDTKLIRASQQSVSDQIDKITEKDNSILFSKLFSPKLYNICNT